MVKKNEQMKNVKNVKNEQMKTGQLKNKQSPDDSFPKCVDVLPEFNGRKPSPDEMFVRLDSEYSARLRAFAKIQGNTPAEHLLFILVQSSYPAVCLHCGKGGPLSSRYCMWCGKPIPTPLMVRVLQTEAFRLQEQEHMSPEEIWNLLEPQLRQDGQEQQEQQEQKKQEQEPQEPQSTPVVVSWEAEELAGPDRGSDEGADDRLVFRLGKAASMFLRLRAKVACSEVEEALSCFLVLFLNGTFCPRCGSMVPAEMMHCVMCGQNVRLNARVVDM